MKDEKLPDITNWELLPFSFKKQIISEEKINGHWDSIAKKLFSSASSLRYITKIPDPHEGSEK